MPQMQENAMVLPHPTPSKYDGADDLTAESCCLCGAAILNPDDEPHIVITRLVDTGRTAPNGNAIKRRVFDYYCDQACVSKGLYDCTETATGKAALKRLVAALLLLTDEDVESRAPLMKELELTEFHGPRAKGLLGLPIQVHIAHMRDQARVLLGKLAVEDAVDWANDAIDRAADFGYKLGRTV